jgi:uncharacterized metal-binding protein YceD (DUF177 family)
MKFRISDIPDGKSSQEVVLDEKNLPLEIYTLKGGLLKVDLVKSNGIIRVHYNLNATIELTCDRSLDLFDYEVISEYEVLFKPGAAESEDDRTAIKPLNLSGNIIDINAEVRDSIILSIPVKKIHPRFLDEHGNVTEFQLSVTDDSEEHSESDITDSRWDALKVLKKNLNN